MTDDNILTPDEWWERHRRKALEHHRRVIEAESRGDWTSALAAAMGEGTTMALMTLAFCGAISQEEADALEDEDADLWDVTGAAVDRIAAEGASASMPLFVAAQALRAGRDLRDAVIQGQPLRSAQGLSQVLFLAGRHATAVELLRTIHEGLWRDADAFRRDRDTRSNGGKVRALELQRRADELKNEAVRLARIEMANTERVKDNPGDISILAEEVSAAWSAEGKKPKVPTIKSYLRKAIDSGHLRLASSEV